MQINFDNIHFTISNKVSLPAPNLEQAYEGIDFAEHFIGRNNAIIIENARASIAQSINAFAGELLFTNSLIETYELFFKLAQFLGIDRIVTSETEDEVFLKMINAFSIQQGVDIYWVDYSKFGIIDLNSLENVLKQSKKALVFLSHVNIFSGLLIPVKKIARMCKKTNAFFALNCTHSMPTMRINVAQTSIDAALFSSAQVHGSSGVWAVFLHNSLISDSEFEKLFVLGKRQMGTANLNLIKSFELAVQQLESQRQTTHRHLTALKQYFIDKVQPFKPLVDILYAENETTISNQVVISLPFSNYWLHRFDIENIAVYVLPTQNKVYHNLVEKTLLCISFSKYNTPNEVDLFVEVLRKLLL